MIASYRLLLTAIFIAFFCFNSQAQKDTATYTDYERGRYLWFYDKLDSAYLMFSRYVGSNPDDILKKGTAYKFMGEILWNLSDRYGAQENLTKALETFNPSNKKHHLELCYTYNILANISVDLKLYEEAINFYNTAITFAGDSAYRFEVLNGKAVALWKSGKYADAINLYDSALATNISDQFLLARLIDNKAHAKWLQSTGYSALPEYWTALKIRTDSQDNMGLIASYQHLADYYAKIKPDSALWYSNRMFTTGKEIGNPEAMLIATDKLISLNNNAGLKQFWYEEFKNLNDSLQLAKDSTKNRNALVRYDVQKIKDKNLGLQNDVFVQGVITWTVIVLAVIALISLLAWYRKRRKRINEEAEKAIRESKLKTSRKVHDVVANGLYRIMNELEHNKDINKEPLLNTIETLYEKSRNISYEDIVATHSSGYETEINQLLKGFANDQTKVVMVGNNAAFWDRITGFQKNQLYLVLNELMVNMTRHSQADNVAIIFRLENNEALISYKDNGIGLDAGQPFGNGLNSTVNRIKSLNGAINFGQSGNGGASIAISFPLESSKI